MKRFFAVLIFSIPLLLASCGDAPEPGPTATATVPIATVAPTQTPTPTATVAASVTLTPSATATQAPSGPFAAFLGGEQLSAMQQRLEKTSLDYLRVISVDIGRRVSGSDEERKAAEYLKKEFESFGYQTSIQEFQRQTRGRDGTPTPLLSRNVIAIKPGATASSPILVLGGHFDTVAAGPGANDNGSGTAVLLAVAKELSKFSLGYEIRFVAFGAEEVGLIGSREYLAKLPTDEKARIQAMLNFDALAGGNIGILIGSPNLTSLALAISRIAGINNREDVEPPNSTSDHFNFLREGISVLYFGGDDYSKIHTPQDTIENVTPRLMGEAAIIGYLITRQLISPQPLSPGV